MLLKRTQSAPNDNPADDLPSDPRADLAHDDPERRRAAALALAASPEAAPLLAERLTIEPKSRVRAAVFDALLDIGTGEVVALLAPLVRFHDAEIRGGAVRTLARLPDTAGGTVQEMLQNPDPDTRIMAMDIIQDMAHPKAPVWLIDLLERETEVNVVGTALDRLSELGDSAAIPAIEAAKARFRDHPYIAFAADAATRAIRRASAP